MRRKLLAPVRPPTYLTGASETTVPEILDSDGHLIASIFQKMHLSV